MLLHNVVLFAEPTDKRHNCCNIVMSYLKMFSMLSRFLSSKSPLYGNVGSRYLDITCFCRYFSKITVFLRVIFYYSKWGLYSNFLTFLLQFFSDKIFFKKSDN